MAAKTNTEKASTVKLRIPAPASPDEDNFLYASINGKAYQIRKGESVEVPVSVAEIIAESWEAERQHLERIRELKAKAEKKG